MELDVCLFLQIIKGKSDCFLVLYWFCIINNQVFLWFLECDCDCYILQFSNCVLEVIVWDYDKVGLSEFIGEVRDLFDNFFNSSICSQFVV